MCNIYNALIVLYQLRAQALGSDGLSKNCGY